MSDDHRRFSVEFKHEELARLAAGELVAALACEFGVHRQPIVIQREPVGRTIETSEATSALTASAILPVSTADVVFDASSRVHKRPPSTLLGRIRC